MTQHPAVPHPTAAADAGRTGIPMANGVAPTAEEATTMDWSASADTAAVGRVLDAMDRADTAMRHAVEAVIRTVDTSACETVFGVAPELVLAQSGRTCSFEARTLLRVAHVLERMPATRHAFATAQLSWSQVRAIVTATTPLRTDTWDQVDDLVGGLAPTMTDVEPDALVFEVDWLAARLLADQQTERERQPVADNRLWLQDRLDGSGTLSGSWDADHWPLLAEAIDSHATRCTDESTDAGADRAAPDADLGSGDPAAGHDASSTDDVHPEDDLALTDAHRHAAALAGRIASNRAAALFELATGWDNATLAPLPSASRTGRRAAARPAVILTTHVDALFDTTTPAWLLTRRAGRIRLASDVVRRWIDTHGADCRLVAVDDSGQVVGVGRRTRVPPDWLRDAIVARDLHDTAPGSTTPARLCDVDHTIDWSAGGPTDVDNLALVSRRWHTRKTAGHLRVWRDDDGRTTWATTSSYRLVTTRPPHLPTGNRNASRMSTAGTDPDRAPP